MSDLESTQPIGRVTRIGRLPDPWAWPPWEAQHSDNTFGNRWDDPEGVYRVLYASSQREGAYVEVLSRFRPDPVVLAELREIDGPMNRLKPVAQHRTVYLLQDVKPHLDPQCERDPQNMPVERGVMQLAER